MPHSMDSVAEKGSADFFTEADKARIRELLLVPDPTLPKVSVLRWREPTKEQTSFHFNFRDLRKALPEATDELIKLMTNAVDQAAKEHRVEIEGIVSAMDSYVAKFSRPIATELGVPLVRYDGKRLSGLPEVRRRRARTFAYLEADFTLGNDSYEAIEMLQDIESCKVPFLVALTGWNLPGITQEFAKELGTEVRILAPILDLKQDPLFTKDPVKLMQLEQEYQELLLRYPRDELLS